MEWTKELSVYIERHQTEMRTLLEELSQIPAPSHHEEKRAAFCRDWLEAQGAKGVYIDEAQNVIWPIGVEKQGSIAVYMAHLDVVFPDTEPLPFAKQENLWYCPGIGDDTVNMVGVMCAAKFIAERQCCPRDRGVLLVLNSCEEGLGNLKGCRQIVKDFGDRITELVTFDGGNCHGSDRAVGSRRYLIEARTQGGHSYGNFGRANAIFALSELICRFYQMTLPQEGRTTYNVGTIEGGTSVNTIAQYAKMLFEFRSDRREALAGMEKQMRDILKECQREDVAVDVTLVGDRPCSGEVDETRMEALRQQAREVTRTHFDREMTFGAGSTDCNIPLSAGIPAICVGFFATRGAHTREEYVDMDSFLPGLCATANMILCHFEKENGV